MEEDFPPNSDLSFWKEAIFAQVGLYLILTQKTEEAISYALRVVFKEGVLSFADFTRTDKKTLGGLITDLRTKLEVDESFDILLTKFLERRNVFVHSLYLQEWWDTDTEDGQNCIWSFLKTYHENLDQVLMLFTAYAIKMGYDIGMPEVEEHRILRANGFLGRLEAEFYPRLGSALKPRSSSSAASAQAKKRCLGPTRLVPVNPARNTKSVVESQLDGTRACSQYICCPVGSPPA